MFPVDVRIQQRRLSITRTVSVCRRSIAAVRLSCVALSDLVLRVVARGNYFQQLCSPTSNRRKTNETIYNATPKLEYRYTQPFLFFFVDSPPYLLLLLSISVFTFSFSVFTLFSCRFLTVD